MHEREQLKHEIKAEIRDDRLRAVRNWAALAGLAMLVGGTVAIDPLIGCVVAGSLLFGLSVAAMLLCRAKPETTASGPQEDIPNDR